MWLASHAEISLQPLCLELYLAEVYALVGIVYPPKSNQAERYLIHGSDFNDPICGSNLQPFDYEKASSSSQTVL